MTVKCPICRSAELQVVTEPREIEADDGTHLAYRDDLFECSKCGERFYTHDQAMASSRNRAAALRTHEELLTPAEIRDIRRRFGLSQAGLEALLRVGAKTVVRWERGSVCQSRAVDTLLRFLDCFGPAAFDRVKGRRVNGKGEALPSSAVAEPRASYRAGRRPRRRR